MERHTMTQSEACRVLNRSARVVARYRADGKLTIRRDEFGRPYYDPKEVHALVETRSTTT